MLAAALLALLFMLALLPALQKAFSLALQESIEQLKAAAQSVNRPYQGENEIRPPREPAQAEPATPVTASVPATPEVPPVNSQRESEPVPASESAARGEGKP